MQDSPNTEMTSTTKYAVSELSVPVTWGNLKGKVWGPVHGRPVLCIHGWADNCGTFNALIPLLPEECRYFAIDMAGHGLSSHRPPGAFYSFPEYVADVRRVVKYLQWTKFSFIGHSMGGVIAAQFSALYPEMVEAVVQLDVLGFLPVDAKEIPGVMKQGIDEILQFEEMAAMKEKVYTYEKAVERLLAVNPTMTERSVEMILERGLTQVEGGFVFSRDRRVNFRNIVKMTLEIAVEMMSRIKAPVLIIVADKGILERGSEVNQKRAISTFLQLYNDRNDTVVKVTGSHHVHLDNPEVVAPFICDFLKTKVLSAGILESKITQ
ncbi:serine hydrolase-like protein [Pholidichthys leucotaenia]